MELTDIDLNQLVLFQQLMVERRVSKVAENLGLTQPAVTRRSTSPRSPCNASRRAAVHATASGSIGILDSVAGQLSQYIGRDGGEV